MVKEHCIPNILNRHISLKNAIEIKDENFLFLVTWAIQNLRVTELTSDSLQLSWDKESQFKEYEVTFKRFSRAKPKKYVIKENLIRFRRTKPARRYFLSVQGNRGLSSFPMLKIGF